MLWLSSVPYFYQEILAEVRFSPVDSTGLHQTHYKSSTNLGESGQSAPVESGPVRRTPTGLCGGGKSIAFVAHFLFSAAIRVWWVSSPLPQPPIGNVTGLQTRMG